MKNIFLVFSLFVFALLVYAPSAKIYAGNLEDLQASYNEVAAKAAKAVVSVQVLREEAQHVIEPEYFFGYVIPQEKIYTQRTSGIGSGVIIDPRGYVLTNYHVVEDAVNIKITTQDEAGNEKTYMATSVASDPALDIALLKIKEKNSFPYLEMNSEANLKVGNIVVAVGYPFGFKQTVTSGIISALNAQLPVQGKRYEHLIQTDAAINPGNSGGPLLNLRGEIIGINTAIASPSGAFAGMGFAVPSSAIKPILEDMLAGRKIKRGWLGVSVVNIDRIFAARLGLSRQTGVLVNQVIAGSPAWKAGIRRGDILLDCDGAEITGAESLVMQTFSRRPNDTVKITLLRAGNKKVLKVILGDRESAASGSENISSSANSSKNISWEGVQLALSANGAQVIDVKASSKLKGHLLLGDIISAVNGIHINSLESMQKAFAAAEISDGVIFDLTRDGQPTYISVQVAH